MPVSTSPLLIATARSHQRRTMERSELNAQLGACQYGL
jgi:hypothetical protein